MDKYIAFGFKIESEFPLPQLYGAIADFPQKADISVCYADLSSVSSSVPVGSSDSVIFREADWICYEIKDVGRFRISDGNLIEVHPCSDISDSLLALYVLGSCTGCILQQRGIFALHGSCVCKGGKAVLICGESGAGKSTLAAEFLRHGWQILTDDVAVITGSDGNYSVVSSYPSQKLWQDSIDYYERAEKDLLPLMQESRREKYHVNVAESFFEGSVPFKVMIDLVHDAPEVSLSEQFGFSKAHKIIENIYLKRSVADDNQNVASLRYAMDIARSIRLFRANRTNDRRSSEELYAMIDNLAREKEKNEA